VIPIQGMTLRAVRSITVIAFESQSFSDCGKISSEPKAELALTFRMYFTHCMLAKFNVYRLDSFQHGEKVG